jgi:hypothetical protein
MWQPDLQLLCIDLLRRHLLNTVLHVRNTAMLHVIR